MKQTAEWIYHYVRMLWHTAASSFYAYPPGHYRSCTVEGKCPVVILPGILARWAFLKPLADMLSREGHPVYVVPALGNNLLQVEVSARIVRALIEEHSIRDAIIVAHSKGGLIGKEFLEFHNPDGCVVGMVSLATPYSGSALASLVPHFAFRELLPSSSVIHRLRSNACANKRIISLIPQRDLYVIAKEGSRLEGALDNVVIPARGHNAILFNEKTWKIVRDSIDRLSCVRLGKD